MSQVLNYRDRNVHIYIWHAGWKSPTKHMFHGILDHICGELLLPQRPYNQAGMECEFTPSASQRFSYIVMSVVGNHL